MKKVIKELAVFTLIVVGCVLMQAVAFAVLGNEGVKEGIKQWLGQ